MGHLREVIPLSNVPGSLQYAMGVGVVTFPLDFDIGVVCFVPHPFGHCGIWGGGANQGKVLDKSLPRLSGVIGSKGCSLSALGADEVGALGIDDTFFAEAVAAMET